MPGAWETHRQKLVLAATIHTEVTTIAWAMGLKRLQIPGDFIGATGMPYDMSRNHCVQQMLQGGYHYLYFHDSDVIAPADTIYRLMAWRQPIVSAMYCRRSPPHGVPVAIKNGKWLDQVPGPGEHPLVEVDFVGAGALLIHRSALERHLPDAPPHKPWFHWRVDEAGHCPPGQALSEDFTWCQRVRATGLKVLLDTSVRCLHVGYSQADLGSLQPLNNQVA